MKNFREWLKENCPEVEIPEGPIISGSWFAKNNIPMVVACTCCETTMVVTSALIDEDGQIYCSSCAGED